LTGANGNYEPAKVREKEDLESVYNWLPIKIQGFFRM
jgi:hypothetical protein